MPNPDLEAFVDLLLGTGMREGEGLAIRPVEPRKGYVDKLHRQDTTKTREDRRLILPTPTPS